LGSRTPWLWLAGGLPFIVYVLTSAGHSYWLDSSEFVAAAVRLDIAHPPGHPLTELYSKLFTLLPLGSLAFRVALGQACAAALAAVCVFRAVLLAISTWGLPERSAAPAAVAGAWLVAFSYGFWFQAVRPEVYALQALCISVIMERIATLEARGAAIEARPLLGVAIVLGLALANHHLIGFLIVPALLPTLVRVLRARGVRLALFSCGFGLLSLGTYSYLPLRAATHPPANLGDPSNLARMAWVVSARVYARDMGTQATQPMAERFVDVFVLLADNFEIVTVLAALIGLYLLVRHPASRRHGVFFTLVFVVNVAVRAWLGPVRANPDMFGYLAPAFMVVGIGAAAFVAALIWTLGHSARRSSKLALRLAPLLPLLGLWLLPVSLARASLARFAAPDAFDEPRIRTLPPRAMVVAATPQTVFRHWESDAVEQVRPDLALVPLPFLGYPGNASATLARHPDSAAIVQAFLEHDQVRAQDLLVSARRRPIFVELDTHTPPEAYRVLRPTHLLHQVLQAPSLVPNALAIEREQKSTYAQLYASLSTDARETETARQLLWIHYMNAVFFAALGGGDLARAEVARAEHLHPQDQNLRALARALADPTRRGPLAAAPFLEF
jgi:hypothetical protein